MFRLLITLFVCCSLSALYVSGRSKNVLYPNFPDQQVAPSNRNGNGDVSSERTTRQTNNRRPLNAGPQTFPTNEEEDPFDGFETPINQGVPSNSNRPFGGNQFQWSNNGNGQRPNQQQTNRPQNQNQRPNNQAQLPNNNNGNQSPNSQNFGGWPTQGQSQRPNNQGQGNNRPANQNQNQQQSSSGEVSEEQRNRCNTQCRERNTNEYNPVCGSDSLTYQNRRFLNCVANCGIPTEFSYIGTCVPTTEGSVRK